MTLHGTIRDGIVVLDDVPNVPNGTPATVIVEQPQPAFPAPSDRMTEEQHRLLMEALDRITALPDENPGDTFSGSDHDQVLYGKP